MKRPENVLSLMTPAKRWLWRREAYRERLDRKKSRIVREKKFRIRAKFRRQMKGRNEKVYITHTSSSLISSSFSCSPFYNMFLSPTSPIMFTFSSTGQPLHAQRTSHRQSPSLRRQFASGHPRPTTHLLCQHLNCNQLFLHNPSFDSEWCAVADY